MSRDTVESACCQFRISFRATYAFEVEAPSQKQQESPKRYSFDYQVQTPVLKRDGASNLQRPLMTTVDRFVIVKPGIFVES